MSQMPPTTPTASGQVMEPHRGVLILVFGILSIVVCFLFGIAAWVMGNRDLEAMARGQMDPTGQGLTQAGKICGIVGCVLAALGLCLGIFWLVLGLVVAGGAAAAGAGGP